MAWRAFFSVSIWLVCLASASHAGIIFHRNKPAQPDQTANLLQTLRGDTDEHHRLSAIEALSKIDPNSNAGIVPALQEAAQNDSSIQVRNAARATLSHYTSPGFRPGQAPAALSQTSEPPMAAPRAPAQANSSTNANNRSTQAAPRVTSRSNVKESSEPPLAGAPPSQPASAPTARTTPAVTGQSPYAPVSDGTKPKPIAIKPESAESLLPKIPAAAAQPAPPARPPVVRPPTSTTLEAPKALPAAPAIPIKSAPAKPEEDGPVLNPPG